MKKFLVCMVCATMLCSCGSDKEVFESWKGWVAMKTCSYNLQEEFKKEYANKGDLSSLFYENETTVRQFQDVWKTDDLSRLGTDMYNYFTDPFSFGCVYDYYWKLLTSDESVQSDDEIVRTVVKNAIEDDYSFKFSHFSDDGCLCFESTAPDKLGDCYYNVEWLFNSENNVNTFIDDLLCLCGSYSDFYDFVMDSVSVLDSEWIENRAGSDVYDVIYQIDAGDSTKYALCQILVNEENSEIQLINSSDSLMDLY